MSHNTNADGDRTVQFGDKAIESIPGIRPSALTGQATTSTGSSSLDSLLGGHAGLALGSSVLVEESGTTDFAGALLRYYAAEGITQGHAIHIVGVGEQWVKELPGVVGDADVAAEAAAERKRKAADEEKMKIAWRYERLGQVDADRASRGACAAASCTFMVLHFYIASAIEVDKILDSDRLVLRSCSRPGPIVSVARCIVAAGADGVLSYI